MRGGVDGVSRLEGMTLGGEVTGDVRARSSRLPEPEAAGRTSPGALGEPRNAVLAKEALDGESSLNVRWPGGCGVRVGEMNMAGPSESSSASPSEAAAAGARNAVKSLLLPFETGVCPAGCSASASVGAITGCNRSTYILLLRSRAALYSSERSSLTRTSSAAQPKDSGLSLHSLIYSAETDRASA